MNNPLNTGTDTNKTMQTEKLQFTNWRARCSSLGKLLTNLPEPLRAPTEEDYKRQATLIAIRNTGKNPETNRPNKWDDAKEKELEQIENIIYKREPQDALPAGAITYLEEVFRHEFWGRRRFLENKYLTKGTICEEDALDLVSQRDNFFYIKNDEHRHNDFIQGEWDNAQGKIKDTKANWDLESFEKADLVTLYNHQLKGYMWLAHSYDLPELETKTESELCYCLVNAPYEQVMDELKKLQWKHNVIDLDNPSEEFVKQAQQLERNMIFDPLKFQREYPYYDFYSPNLDFGIPAHMRIKSINVKLEPDDIKHMTRRVTLAREWLKNKEIETLKTIENGWNN